MRAHPGMPGVTVTTGRELYAENGELVHGVDLVVTDEILEQWKQGYRCAWVPHGCGALQLEAYPKKCIEPYCNFNLKRDLADWFRFAFRGEVTLWPDQDDGYDPEREAFQQRTGMWLPE